MKRTDVGEDFEKKLENNEQKIKSERELMVNERYEILKKEFTGDAGAMFIAKDAVKEFVGEKNFENPVDKTIIQDDQKFEDRLIQEGYDKEEIRSIAGYYDPHSDEVHIRQKTSQKTDLYIHEYLHFQTEGFDCELLNEGTTEYFTQQICKMEGVCYSEGCYTSEREIAEILDKKLGNDVLKNAYLDGDDTTIRNTFDTTYGKGGYEAFIRDLESAQFCKENKFWFNYDHYIESAKSRLNRL